MQSPRNQVRYERDDVDSAGEFTGGRGLLEAIRQNPTGEADGSAPELAYTYEQQVEDGELVILRPQKVEYPGGREVYLRYSDSGVGQVLSRLEDMAPAAEASSAWAEYGYLGAATITRTARPKVQGGLELDYDPDSDGSFSGWDRFGRVIEHEWRDDNEAVLDGYHYGHDAAGNRTFRQNMHSGSNDQFDKVYDHDGLHRLVDMQRGELDDPEDPDPGIVGTPQAHQDWDLDGLGNWDEFGGQSRSHNEANEIETISGNWPDPEHDAAGNVIAAPGSEDPTERRHYVYDAWNRLAVVHEDDGEGERGETLVIYRYNGLHQRVWERDHSVGPPPPEPGEERVFLYNENWQVIEEHRGPELGEIKHYADYLWCLRYIDSPVVRFRDSSGDDGDPDGTLDETLYYTTDANMNVTALVAPGSGEVKERYAYDPYGRAAVLDGNWQEISWPDSKRNEIRFTGHRLNPTTGTYHARNREYHPTLGRFMQRDPLGYVDGMSLYTGYFVPDELDFLGLVADSAQVVGPKRQRKRGVHWFYVPDSHGWTLWHPITVDFTIEAYIEGAAEVTAKASGGLMIFGSGGKKSIEVSAEAGARAAVGLSSSVTWDLLHGYYRVRAYPTFVFEAPVRVCWNNELPTMVVHGTYAAKVTEAIRGRGWRTDTASKVRVSPHHSRKELVPRRGEGIVYRGNEGDDVDWELVDVDEDNCCITWRVPWLKIDDQHSDQKRRNLSEFVVVREGGGFADKLHAGVLPSGRAAIGAMGPIVVEHAQLFVGDGD